MFLKDLSLLFRLGLLGTHVSIRVVDRREQKTLQVAADKCA